MKKFLSKKWLGIPLAAILAVILAVGFMVTVRLYYKLDCTIPSTVTVTEPAPTYTLTVNAGTGGTATGGVAGVASGTTSNISATATSGYHFSGWTGDYVGADNPHLVTITSNMTVTANFTQDTVANLYSDLNCTTLVTSLDFGNEITGGSPVTKVVYFKASRSNSVPSGYGFGEINPTTIVATSNIDPAVATFSYMVGKPFGAVINGNHPCMIILTVIPVGAGSSSFDIHVTGNGQ